MHFRIFLINLLCCAHKNTVGNITILRDERRCLTGNDFIKSISWILYRGKIQTKDMLIYSNLSLVIIPQYTFSPYPYFKRYIQLLRYRIFTIGMDSPASVAFKIQSWKIWEFFLEEMIEWKRRENEVFF